MFHLSMFVLRPQERITHQPWAHASTAVHVHQNAHASTNAPVTECRKAVMHPEALDQMVPGPLAPPPFCLSAQRAFRVL